MKTNLLIRHAEKELDKKSFFGNEVGLTQHGIDTSLQLGQEFKYQLNSIYTSPIRRCVETAEHISKTAYCPVIKKNNLLGDPGIFIINTALAQTQFYVNTPQEIVKHLLSDKPNPPGFCISTEKTILHFLNCLVNLNSEKPGTSLFITHDIILATLLGYYFEETWPDYLEGLTFWQDNNKIHLQHHNQEIIL